MGAAAIELGNGGHVEPAVPLFLHRPRHGQDGDLVIGIVFGRGDRRRRLGIALQGTRDEPGAGPPEVGAQGGVVGPAPPGPTGGAKSLVPRPARRSAEAGLRTRKAWGRRTARADEAVPCRHEAWRRESRGACIAIRRRPWADREPDPFISRAPPPQVRIEAGEVRLVTRGSRAMSARSPAWRGFRRDNRRVLTTPANSGS